MVIQCPHCQARFKLPRDKVKPGGTKVRCTKCRIVFIVTPPQDLPDAPVARPGEARDAADGLENSALGADFETDFGADFFSDGDEGDDFLRAQTAMEQDEDDFFGSGDSAFDDDDKLSWSEDAEDPFAVAEIEQDEDLPSAEDLFPATEDTPVAGPEDISQTEISLTLAPEEDIGSKKDSGLPEEGAFFEEASPRSALPAPVPPAERRRRFPWGRVWLLLLLLLVAGGVYSYHARDRLAASVESLLIRWQLAPVPPPRAGGLKPLNLSGFFVTNQREGRLFVIQGQVLNEGPEARAAIVVQGALYDRSGRQLARQSAFCGNPISQEQLRDWPMLRIADRMQNQFGEMLANLNLEPQKAIPFTLVFKGPAGEVAEFEVSVASSEAVIK